MVNKQENTFFDRKNFLGSGHFLTNDILKNRPKKTGTKLGKKINYHSVPCVSFLPNVGVIYQYALMQICRISILQISNLHSAPPIPKHCFILSNHQTPRQKGLRSLGGQKKHKMKNDPCRKLLLPGVNRFVEKGPLKPEKNKRA